MDKGHDGRQVQTCAHRTGLTFYLDTHGCAKNQVDSEYVITSMLDAGFDFVQEPDAANVIIINSCAFIESAKKESLDAVFCLRKTYPNKVLILTGCLAYRYGDALKDDLPEVDLVYSAKDLSDIGRAARLAVVGELPTAMATSAPCSFVDDAPFHQTFASTTLAMATAQDTTSLNTDRPIDTHDLPPSITDRPINTQPAPLTACDFPDTTKQACTATFPKRVILTSPPAVAFVKIAEGCSNHCTFCAIPIIRGEVASRSISSVVQEVRHLVATKHIQEVNLIAQDLASFAKDRGDCALPRLLQAIDAIDGDFFVRLLYIHPDNFSSELLQTIKSCKKVLPYFDIPFQNGDDAIIKAMNRRGSHASYVSLVQKIRATLPHAVIRTTIMTGFPGETDTSFCHTIDFLKEIRPLWAGFFVYSREEGTPAYSMAARVKKSVAKKRLAQLQELQSAITADMLHQYIGTEQKILVEEVFPPNKDEGGVPYCLGRAWFCAVEVDGVVVVDLSPQWDDYAKASHPTIAPGSFITAKINEVNGVDLYAVAI